jgi:hypothetical protein
MTKGNTICPRPFHGGGIIIIICICFQEILNSDIHVTVYVPSDFMNIIEFGFKQLLTSICDTCSLVEKKKKKYLPAGSLGKNRPGVRGNKQFLNCGLK